MQRGDWVGVAAALRRSSTAYAAAGALDDAVRACQQRIDLHPNDVDARLELARLYALRDDAPAADLDDLTASTDDGPIITGEPVDIVVEAIDRVVATVPDGRLIEGLERGPADLYLGPEELPDIPLFRGFSPASRNALLQSVELVRYRDGATISSPDEPVEVLCLVHHGIVGVRRYDATGNVVELARLHAGEFFGEFALLGGRPPGAWYDAMTDVQLFELSPAVIEVITEFHPGFADSVADAYAHRMLLELIQHAAVFGDLNDADRAAISRRFERVSYRAGDTVLRRGEVNGRLFFVVGGSLRVTDVDNGTSEFGPGYLFGFHSAVMNAPLDANVVCTADAMLLVLPDDALEPLIADARELVARIGTRSVSPRIVEVGGAAI